MKLETRPDKLGEYTLHFTLLVGALVTLAHYVHWVLRKRNESLLTQKSIEIIIFVFISKKNATM